MDVDLDATPLDINDNLINCPSFRMFCYLETYPSIDCQIPQHSFILKYPVYAICLYYKFIGEGEKKSYIKRKNTNVQFRSHYIYDLKSTSYIKFCVKTLFTSRRQIMGNKTRRFKKFMNLTNSILWMVCAT